MSACVYRCPCGWCGTYETMRADEMGVLRLCQQCGGSRFKTYAAGTISYEDRPAPESEGWTDDMMLDWAKPDEKE